MPLHSLAPQQKCATLEPYGTHAPTRPQTSRRVHSRVSLGKLSFMNIQSVIQSVINSARFLGRELTEKALVLIYTFCDDRTPIWARTVILGALAYLLSPIDACPDPIPVVGLADDMATLLGALATLAGVISPEHVARARETATSIFK